MVGEKVVPRVEDSGEHRQGERIEQESKRRFQQEDENIVWPPGSFADAPSLAAATTNPLSAAVKDVVNADDSPRKGHRSRGRGSGRGRR